MQKRDIIMTEIIQNIRISKQGDFSWVTNDYPLLIGFVEFYMINTCSTCEPDMPENDFADKMIIPLQNLFETIMC